MPSVAEGALQARAFADARFARSLRGIVYDEMSLEMEDESDELKRDRITVFAPVNAVRVRLIPRWTAK